MRMWNKKGSGEALLFFAFIFIMSIIFVGIILGVSGFYGGGYDFRQLESEILYDKVSKCFLESEKDFFSDDFKGKLMEECRFNENVGENHLIYFNRTSDGEVFFLGVLDYTNQCFFEGAEKNLAFPKCVKKTLVKNGESFEIIVGANQKSRRIRV